MKANAKTEAAVLTVLNKFAEGYVKRDVDGILALFAPDPDVIIFGTGADEKRVGLTEIRTQVERDFSQSDSATLTYEWTSISAAGSVAWVAADAAMKVRIAGQEIALSGRLTVVLENRAEKWLIVHVHFSMPFAGQGGGIVSGIMLC